jgi:hypothetical protein
MKDHNLYVKKGTVPLVYLAGNGKAQPLKKRTIPLFIPLATARHCHSGICPMAYMLKGKVSWLRLVAIIWNTSSDAARQACGKAASEAACEAATEGQVVWRGSAEGQMPGASATMQRSIAAAEKGQAIWPGTGRGGLRGGLLVSAAVEESQAARRESGGAREERNGGAGIVEGKQILEEQCILEGT